MTTIVEAVEDLELEAEVEAAMPMLDALAEMSENFKQTMQELILNHPLIKEEERALAFSSLCQMLSMDAITELADDIECSPLDVVDTWADAFYEAFDEDEDDNDDEEDEEEEDGE